MKKRILTSSLITVIFALIVVTASFIALVNLKEIDRTKEVLEIYNNIIIKNNEFEKDNLEEYKINKYTVRFTLIDNEGNVLKDSENTSLENHANREEITMAFRNGKYSLTRYSSTEGTNVVYYATKINDNMVIRSSVTIININILCME